MAAARWWLANSATLGPVLIAVLVAILPVAPAAAQGPPLLGLAPLVVLAPRCGLRPPDWGQRLDVALADALAEAADAPADAAALAQAELATMRAWQADPIPTCARWRADPATARALTSADRLLAHP